MTMRREHLEQLLRDPNNLFGPPRGEGYDYWKNGTVAIAILLTVASAIAFQFWADVPNLSNRFAWGLLAVPFVVAWDVIWPITLGGLVTAFLTWYGTLRSATWKWHRSGRWLVWAIVGGMGWMVGFIRLNLL